MSGAAAPLAPNMPDYDRAQTVVALIDRQLQKPETL